VAALDADLEIHLDVDSPRHSGGRETASQLTRRLRPLFWDVDLVDEHLRDNSLWVLRRVLQYGDWEDVHQARCYFGDERIRDAVRHRSMDTRTRRLWEVVLETGSDSP
jgi:hypothetical protein